MYFSSLTFRIPGGQAYIQSYLILAAALFITAKILIYTAILVPWSGRLLINSLKVILGFFGSTVLLFAIFISLGGVISSSKLDHQSYLDCGFYSYALGGAATKSSNIVYAYREIFLFFGKMQIIYESRFDNLAISVDRGNGAIQIFSVGSVYYPKERSLLKSVDISNCK
jgi:hypothetical protein